MKVVSLDKFAGELGKYAEQNMEAYQAAVINALAMNLRTLVEASPVDTGLYAQSWDLVIEEKRAILGNYAPHAGIIEFGARPFTPPMQPLLEWARRVLKKSEIDDDCWGLATYTRNKIAREGMKPKHILTDSLDKIISDIRTEIEKAMR